MMLDGHVSCHAIDLGAKFGRKRKDREGYSELEAVWVTIRLVCEGCIYDEL
jgi:hypothetical protein